MAMVHGDLFSDNVVFQGDRVVGILDVEEVCLQPRLLDIGMTILGTCRRNGGLAPATARHLIQGYVAVSELTATEHAHVGHFVRYAATAIAFWRFRQFHIRNPDPDRADAHLEMQVIADRFRFAT